jgi:sporulation protein YlmC with PRC-barrel domain
LSHNFYGPHILDLFFISDLAKRACTSTIMRHRHSTGGWASVRQQGTMGIRPTDNHMVRSHRPGNMKGCNGPWEWEYFPERLRLSAILNRAVLNNKGEDVGEINDLIINQNGKVARIVLSVGRIINVHEKLVAMPFMQLKVTDLGIVYDVSKEELKNRQAFSYEKK